MTTRLVSWPCILAAALACAGCGADFPEPPAHGLIIEVLEATPTGEPVATFTDVRPGRWKIEVEKTWRRKEGPLEKEGQAALDLFVETLAKNAGWETHVEIRVRRAEGIAEEYVRAFDGLRYRVAHDEQGRPDPSTLRFDAVAPRGARMFLRGLWPAGLPGSTPWFPARPLRVGDTWTREELGDTLTQEDLADAEQARLLFEGGGRLEAVDRLDGETVLDVRLVALLTVEEMRWRAGVAEARGLGIRDRGRGTFRARDGLPLNWSLAEDIVVGTVADGVTERIELTLRVEGRTTELRADDR